MKKISSYNFSADVIRTLAIFGVVATLIRKTPGLRKLFGEDKVANVK